MQAGLTLACFVLLFHSCHGARSTVDRVEAYEEEEEEYTIPTDPNDVFRGGHRDNQAIDKEACEFKKTHDAKDMDRFENEAKFLRAATASPVWRPLIPQLKRVEEIGGRPFMVLEDVTCRLERAIIADFKLGAQSWKPAFGDMPGASLEKRAKMEKLDAASTTKALGVRITSAQIPPALDSWVDGSVPARAKYQLAGRKAVKGGLATSDWLAASTQDDFKRVLEAFLPTKPLQTKFVEKLKAFRDVFRTQTTYRFTGGSLLVYYDGVGAGSEDPNLGMVMIDFPHTLGSPEHEFGEIDSGVLRGLNSLSATVHLMINAEG